MGFRVACFLFLDLVPSIEQSRTWMIVQGTNCRIAQSWNEKEICIGSHARPSSPGRGDSESFMKQDKRQKRIWLQFHERRQIRYSADSIRIWSGLQQNWQICKLFMKILAQRFNFHPETSNAHFQQIHSHPFDQKRFSIAHSHYPLSRLQRCSNEDEIA